MRGVLHAEVFGFNFSADINPYQRSDDCVIAAGQITERPRRLSKTSADAPETERGTQVGGTHEHTSTCLSSSEMWLTRSIARNHVQSLVFFLKGVYEGRSLYMARPQKAKIKRQQNTPIPRLSSISRITDRRLSHKRLCSVAGSIEDIFL